VRNRKAPDGLRFCCGRRRRRRRRRTEASFSNPRDAVPGFVFGFGKSEASTLELELRVGENNKEDLTESYTVYGCSFSDLVS
jgi:hypothetical protein